LNVRRVAKKVQVPVFKAHDCQTYLNKKITYIKKKKRSSHCMILWVRTQHMNFEGTQFNSYQ
jgi:hypothetical protein